MRENSRIKRIAVAVASPGDMEDIYRIRHDVYATELGQHQENLERRLIDSLDGFNSYVVARVGGVTAGFVSITPPGGGSYSIDKYFRRNDVPVSFGPDLFEIRILTVVKEFRGSAVATALSYAALRWIESQGGSNIVVIGRLELLEQYLRAGLAPTGLRTTSGKVTFELLTGRVTNMLESIRRTAPVDLDQGIVWEMAVPGSESSACFHGGAFFDAIGREFENLDKADDVINADVLDAWFSPSPEVISKLSDHLLWAAKTSPPTGCEGMVDCISRTRGIPPESVLAGSGSSSLIFLALRYWLRPSSRALLLDPSYGEYAHVLDNVIRCRVDRLSLSLQDGFRLDSDSLRQMLKESYDLVVIVNPNNPTGHHVPRREMQEILEEVPPETKVWIDEAYVDFIDSGESLESFAADSRNVVVCKSMSKVYALSGLRVGYLCGPPGIIRDLLPLNPPWGVSLPGQLAAVTALQDQDYYKQRWRETHVLRRQLAADLRDLDGLRVLPGTANYLFCELPADGPGTELVMERCRKHNLFLRDPAASSPRLGSHTLRIAVKDAATNKRIVNILEKALA